MPYPTKGLLQLSLDALRQDYSPLLIVSVPCMLSKRLPTAPGQRTAQRTAIPFGSRDEREWLAKYFSVPGGPADKPYYMPATGDWVQDQFPGRALQRRRTDFTGKAFYHPDDERWALTGTAARVFNKEVLKGKDPILLVALMAWMWRNREIKTIRGGLSEFIEFLGIDRDGLIGKVYDDTIPKAFEDAGLANEAVSAAGIAELLDSTPPAPLQLDLVPTVTRIGKILAEAHFIVPDGFLKRIVTGWLVGDIVVLVGPTGSGKSRLSTLLGQALHDVLGDRFFNVFMEIGPDYDVSQFLGYQNLSGTFTAGRFATDVLFVGEPTDPRLVVLDEWNLAQIDAYFAPVLSALEARVPMRLPGNWSASEIDPSIRRAQPAIGDGLCTLPEDTFFIATCNSWIDEPETRLPISGPVKRRCRIIAMPNVLEAAFREEGKQGIVDFCNELLAQERARVTDRVKSGLPSVWDTHRASRLAAVESLDNLDARTSNLLVQIAQILLTDKKTAAMFTPGILQDTLLTCAYGDAPDQIRALGEALADKILPQLRGEPNKLEVVVNAAKDLPNAADIRALAETMGAFSTASRLRPFV